MTPQQRTVTKALDSPLALYRSLCVGNEGYLSLVRYELITLLFANSAGLLGLAARSLLYPLLFKTCRGRLAIGKGGVLRNPGAIAMGAKVLIDDYVTLDAKGSCATISLEDFVSIGKFSIVASKDAEIRIGKGTNIGSHCRIASQSRITIGESTLIAAYCYIGPGNHKEADESAPLISREMDIKGGVHIGSNVWIGARATILDGVHIGDRAIVGAHSLVKEDVPAGATVAGTPARIIHSK